MASGPLESGNWYSGSLARSMVISGEPQREGENEAMTTAAREAGSMVGTRGAPNWKNWKRRFTRDNLTLVLFLAIPLLIYAIWVWGPALATIWISFTRWDNVSAPQWVGLQNYQ